MPVLRSPHVPYSPGKSRFLHPAIRFEVRMRDQGRCTHVARDGARCEETRRLEIHHIIEVSRGGDDSISNLQSLCSNHHQERHRDFTISSQRTDRKKDQFGIWIRSPEEEYESAASNPTLSLKRFEEAECADSEPAERLPIDKFVSQLFAHKLGRLQKLCDICLFFRERKRL